MSVSSGFVYVAGVGVGVGGRGGCPAVGQRAAVFTAPRVIRRSAAPPDARRSVGFRSARCAAHTSEGGNGSGGGEKRGSPRKKGKATEESVYRNTVNLPRTDFDQRANAVHTEPKIQSFWEEQRVYETLVEANRGDVYTLHDGPPYANGGIHMGHALNKVLKDFVNRYQLLRGRRASLVPGWDCHGLPIELKVLQTMKSKERQQLTPLTLRERAREFALSAVDEQRRAFQRLGVWADWQRPYLTLQPEYEAAQIEVFGRMFLRGFIYRGLKPVHWSPSSRTALAEAELEYPDDHVSKSVYAAFRVANARDSACDALRQHSDALHVAVWTTTPWTLPANRAVAVNVELTYAVVADGDRHLIIAEELVGSVSGKLKRPLQLVASVKGQQLVGLEYDHPLERARRCRVVAGGDYITTDSGTGLVHTAPGHGQEDFVVAQREGIEMISPVDAGGRFTPQAGADGRFAGMDVLGDGNDAVIADIDSRGVLLLREPYRHKYPYDWRTKKPTIFRATDQWFASVDGFKSEALSAVGGVKWVPATNAKRLYNMIEGRSDWCISRQRTWGVPIPVFFGAENDVVIDEEIITHVASVIRERGSDSWWSLDVDELLPAKHRGRGLTRGTDTMDVWFDSGTSWAAVTSERAGLHCPAELYLEGSDQHRGWFQSSLLTSVATRGAAPYETVLTHGFVLDERGNKMSKSLGNVVDPCTIINGGNNQKTDPPYGADVLRLWVASVDYNNDVLIGGAILKSVADSYRKIRNTLRYMVSNVGDFDRAAQRVAFERLPSLDQHMLRRMVAAGAEVQAAYDAFAFGRLYQTLLRFCITELSNFYLDVAKDRLYISARDAPRRRSCQTVLAALLDFVSTALAPILPHTAEDLYGNLPWREHESHFLAGWWRFDDTWAATPPPPAEQARWETIARVRTDVNKCLDAARMAKVIGAGLDARVVLHSTDIEVVQTLKALNEGGGNEVDELKYLLLVSAVDVVDDAAPAERCEHVLSGEESGALVGVTPADGQKCDRCWCYSAYVGRSRDHPLLCARCEEVVVGLGIPTQPSSPLVNVPPLT